MNQTPWLRVMLEEIERKRRDAADAQAEALRRATGRDPSPKTTTTTR